MDDRLETLQRYGFKLPEEDPVEEMLADPWRVDVPLRLCADFGEPEMYDRFRSPRLIWEDSPYGTLGYHAWDDGSAVLDASRLCEWGEDKRLSSWTWWTREPGNVTPEEIGRIDAETAVFYNRLRDVALDLRSQIVEVWDAPWRFESSASWTYDEKGTHHPDVRFSMAEFKALDSFHVRRGEDGWRGKMRTDEGLSYNVLAGPLTDVLIALRRIAEGYLQHDLVALGEGSSPGWNKETVLSDLACDFV